MKKLLLIVALLLWILPVNAADTDLSVQDDETYSQFHFNKFVIDVPSTQTVDIENNEAIVKTPDGQFGFSLKIEKANRTSIEGALEICQLVTKELKMNNADIKAVTINGLNGARVKATMDDALLNIVVLTDGGKRYVKLVVVSTPEQAAKADHVINSLKQAD